MDKKNIKFREDICNVINDYGNSGITERDLCTSLHCVVLHIQDVLKANDLPVFFNVDKDIEDQYNQE